MPLREDILVPIPGENPSGADLRYYFTLDAGTTISQVTVNLVYHECGSVSLKQFSGSTYYADIDCTGRADSVL